MSISATRKRKFAFASLAATVAAVFLIACGSSPTTPYARERSPELALSIEDVRNAGFKTTRQYDVEGLTGATEAWFGFRRATGLDPVEYEIRTYPSHDDALEYGAFFAQDVLGPDGNIFAKDAAWKTGTADRWSYRGGDFNSSRVPKYYDYLIFGNLVVLCQGFDKATSQEACDWMAAQLEASSQA